MRKVNDKIELKIEREKNIKEKWTVIIRDFEILMEIEEGETT